MQKARNLRFLSPFCGVIKRVYLNIFIHFNHSHLSVSKQNHNLSPFSIAIIPMATLPIKTLIVRKTLPNL